MSKYRLSKIVQAEINKLNQEIDLKIIRGQSYKKEARRHKFLLSQLDGINRQSSFRATPPRAHWFSRVLLGV
jgi:hypothetical protein